MSRLLLVLLLLILGASAPPEEAYGLRIPDPLADLLWRLDLLAPDTTGMTPVDPLQREYGGT